MPDLYRRFLDLKDPIVLWNRYGGWSIGWTAGAGNRAFSYTGRDLLAFPGKDRRRDRAFFNIYHYSRNTSDPGTQAYRLSGRDFAVADITFCIFGSDHIRRIWIYTRPPVCIAAVWHIQGMGSAPMKINYKKISKILKKIYKQWEIFWTNKKFRV